MECGAAQRLPRLIVPMSSRLVIPWWVALQQSPPPLHQLCSDYRKLLLERTLFQRTVICPYVRCLTQGVQSTGRSPELFTSAIYQYQALWRAVNERLNEKKAQSADSLIHGVSAQLAVPKQVRLTLADLLRT
jgi:hypothetical protein